MNYSVKNNKKIIVLHNILESVIYIVLDYVFYRFKEWYDGKLVLHDTFLASKLSQIYSHYTRHTLKCSLKEVWTIHRQGQFQNKNITLNWLRILSLIPLWGINLSVENIMLFIMVINWLEREI